MIGTEGARLLREKRVQGRPHRRKSAEGGPPAESECLEWKSTFPFYKPTKKLSANNYYLVCEQKGSI
ncbi:hypothetical protein B8W99_19450 [Peribacillus simplex]|nr:hypothetical protein B8W99_19450 [Peribacillus simplex]